MHERRKTKRLLLQIETVRSQYSARVQVSLIFLVMQQRRQNPHGNAKHECSRDVPDKISCIS